MGQAMMHSPADDPLLFREAPNVVPWSHLFDLDSRRPTYYTVKKCLLLYLDPGLWSCCGTGIWILDCLSRWCGGLFLWDIQIKNATMSQDRSLAQTATLLLSPLIQQHGLAVWCGLAHTVLRSWTSLLSTDALLIGADVTARCRELSK